MTTVTGIQVSSALWGALVAFLTLVPIVIGFVVVLPDANDHGQPGWLWALLTIPFGWFTLLAYVVFLVFGNRTVRPQR